MTDLALTEPTEDQGEGQRSLTDSLARVRRRTQIVVTERWLVIAGGVLIPLGIVLVLLGWYGASHTTRLFEEIPYLISGGLFGLVLVVVGGACYFGYWLARLLSNEREMLGALLRIEEKLDAGALPVSGNAVAVAAPAETLVATKTGTMYHRPDCSVVRGRSDGDLRLVNAGENGLSACQICAPD